MIKALVRLFPIFSLIMGAASILGMATILIVTLLIVTILIGTVSILIAILLNITRLNFGGVF